MSESTREIRTRPVDAAVDETFLFELYASTRDDLPMLDPPQRDALMRMQFSAQNNGYGAQYPGAEHDLILFEDRPVGRMIVLRSESEIVFVDLAILPEYRSRGIGTQMIMDRIAEAESSNRILTFHALKSNRAIGLYLRLGCEISGENAAYYLFEWKPKPQGAQSAIAEEFK